jgi:DNA-binding MarR family transcriptional regulator
MARPQKSPSHALKPNQLETNEEIKKVASTLVLRKFRQVFNAVKSHFQQVKKKAGVGGAQIWALSLVHNKLGIGVNDLALAMDIHQTTASNLVRSLVKMQMLAVERNGPDKRSVQLYIMPSGQKVLLKAPEPFAGVLPEALRQLDLVSLERLDADMEQLLKLLAVKEEAAQIPLGQL